MSNLFKITANTFKEAVREPVFFLMLLAALLLIAHTPSAALYVFSEQLKLVVDSSMATTLIFGLVAGVLSASHTVTREMRNGTVLLLLSKPVTRWSFILGKVLGIGIAVTLFTVLCNLATIVAVYIATDQFRMDMGLYFGLLAVFGAACVAGMAANFWRGSAFPEIGTYAMTVLLPVLTVICVLSKEAPTLSMADLVRALTLVSFSAIAMSTFAVVFATRLDVVGNLSVCAVVFFLGLVSGYLFQGRFYQEIDNGLIRLVLDGLYAVIPNWQYFWLADAIAVNRPIPNSYIVNAAIYMLLYIVLCTSWAIALFENKEVAGDNRI